jgi:chromosome segregation ATPase
MTVSDTAALFQEQANPSSSGELNLLRQCITELEAEHEEWIMTAFLYEKKINKFKETIGALSSENFDLKNKIVKLKTSIEEQERKNTELESRLAIIEQSSLVVDG